MTSTPCILVVDDHPATRYSTTRVLQLHGFRVLEAATGGEALKLASQDVDLVILDINLPDMDGMIVCQQLRQRPDTARMPVVHLSATRIGELDKARGLDAGADGYLTHPVEPLVLISTINAFLRTRGAEEEMRRSEAKFRAVFDHAPSGIALLDAHLHLLDMNQALSEMLGIKRETLIGRDLREVIDASDPSFPTRSTDLDSGFTCIAPLRRPDGSLVQLEWRISAHSIPGEHLAVVNDTTSRIREQREREQLIRSERSARAEAERANRLKDDFLAVLSHELRNPLSAIVGWSNVLKAQLRDNPVVEGVHAILRNADVQARLIAELLDVSRITSGKLDLQWTRVNAVEVARDVLRSVRASAELKGVMLESAFSSDVMAVVCDPARLQQILWNLMSNAVKFTEREGRVHLALAIHESELHITVTDSGCGIAAELLPHIFERFRQEVPKRRGGLGLGLAIVKQLVELHDGTVSVASDGEGRGATFSVILPNAGNAATVFTASEAQRIADQFNGIRILVVDDDPDARTLVCRILTDAGAECVDAPDVAAALAQIGVFVPDILISDIGMGSVNGYDLIREVRARRSAKELPAIALTAFASDDDHRRSLEAGFQIHLCKPFEPQQLLAAVASLRE